MTTNHTTDGDSAYGASADAGSAADAPDASAAVTPKRRPVSSRSGRRARAAHHIRGKAQVPRPRSGHLGSGHRLRRAHHHDGFGCQGWLRASSGSSSSRPRSRSGFNSRSHSGRSSRASPRLRAMGTSAPASSVEPGGSICCGFSWTSRRCSSAEASSAALSPPCRSCSRCSRRASLHTLARLLDGRLPRRRHLPAGDEQVQHRREVLRRGRHHLHRLHGRARTLTAISPISPTPRRTSSLD